MVVNGVMIILIPFIFFRSFVRIEPTGTMTKPLTTGKNGRIFLFFFKEALY